MTPQNRTLQGTNWILDKGEGVKNDLKKLDSIYECSPSISSFFRTILRQKIWPSTNLTVSSSYITYVLSLNCKMVNRKKLAVLGFRWGVIYAWLITYFRKFVFHQNYQNTKLGCEIFISTCSVFACLALISKKSK